MLNTLIKKILNESLEKETTYYMFFQNLNQIKNQIEELLSLDKESVDKILKNGHDWASDHISTSKDDIEEVYNFLTNTLEEISLIDEAREIGDGVLTIDKVPNEIKDALKKGKIIGVSFVKANGIDIRHMSFRRFVKGYQRTGTERGNNKSEVLLNNNLIIGVDANDHIKAVRDGLDPQDAAKRYYKNFRLDHVLGFVSNGKFFDMREINNIKDRFGEELYNSLSPSMIKVLQKEESESKAIEQSLGDSSQ